MTGPDDGTNAPTGEHDPTGGVDTGGTHLDSGTNLPAAPEVQRLPSAVTPGAPATRAGQDMFGASLGGDTSGFGGLVPRTPAPLSTPKPYGGWFDEATDSLEAAWPGFSENVLRVTVEFGELTLHVKAAAVREICQVLRDDPNLRFELLSSVSGVDYIDQPDRLHSVYHLTSMTYRRRLRVEAAVSIENPHLPSVCAVYPTADFQEREAYDMFGIIYDGHPALTRILMPDDWDGHPQRKDYPLGGIPVEYKGASIPPPDERRAYS